MTARAITVQVNGKNRCEVQIDESHTDAQIPQIAKAAALIDPSVIEAIAGREIARVVYNSRVINIVTT